MTTLPLSHSQIRFFFFVIICERNTQYFPMGAVTILIRLDGYPGWPESWPGVSIIVFYWHMYYIILLDAELYLM